MDPTDPDPQHCSQAHKTACLTVVQSLTQGVGSMKLEPTATARPAAVVNRGKEGKTLAITANLIRQDSCREAIHDGKGGGVYYLGYRMLLSTGAKRAKPSPSPPILSGSRIPVERILGILGK